MRSHTLYTLPELPIPCIYEGNTSPMYDDPVGYTAKQMQTLIDNTQVKDFDWCARMSYKMADEMMRARG